MATPFVKESKRHQPLEIHDFHKILTLLERHGFSSHRYYDLGLYLGLHSHTLHDIRNNCREDGDRCLRECLIAWLQQRDDVMTGGQTYDALIQVLREMEENAVADGIERYIRVIDSPPKERHTVQPGELGIQDLVEILDLLKEHGYSGVRYYDLGLYLGLTHHTLHDIQNEYYGDFDRCLAECLEAWLKRKDNVDSVGGPTYDTLIQALRKMGENAVADGIERDLRGHIVPPTANPISTEDTPAADRIPGTQNPPTERKIEEWLKEGEVELEITRINMHGAPGAGKTCSQHLLLNEPPPSSTDSTPIACPAVKATRISIDGKNKWERVKEEDLLNQLASDFKEAPNETKHETTSTKINEAQMSSDRSGEPSLEDPTKNKPAEKKPTDMEVIKEISDALEKGNAKNLSKNWVYFIDSGGQPAYRELLPLFTRAAALNIITIDLTKGLDEKCKFQYRISQHMSPINTDLKYSNRDIIRSTISSEAMLNSIKIPYVAEPEKHKGIHARYLVLGTRKELVTEDELKEMDKSLISSSSSLDLKNIIQRIPEKSIIFPVNTLLPAGSEEREEACVELCTAISNCNLKMKIKLPIRLFAFEISLQREARNKKRSFLTKKEVIKIGEDLLLDESDIDDALQYLHNVTIILYYPAVLPNIIFVDPEPILDVLSRLIAITYIDQSNLHLIAKATDERIRLKECGLFKEDLLGKIGQQKIFDKDFESSHMITLLKHLHIIAEINSEGTGRDYAEIGADYFFPCALPSCDKLNDPPTEIQPLLIAWEIKNKGTITLAIPQGLFPLTIVHLLGQKDVVDFSPVGKEYYRCHDAMSLRVYKDYTIDIINRYTHIEIHFDGCKNLCPQIHELVTDAIKKSSKDINVNDDHIFAFKCSIGEHCYCIVKEDESSTRCTQCRSHCKVLQGDDDDSYRCWFNIPQLTSPGAKPSLERPPTTRPTVPPTGLLGTTDLIDVLDVLDDHEYSGVEYYDLGLRLGLHSRTLNVIKENNKGNVRSCLRECLAAWLEQRDSVMRRGGPTYNTFIKALRKMGENAVADGIERDINKNAVADAIEFH